MSGPLSVAQQDVIVTGGRQSVTASQRLTGRARDRWPRALPVDEEEVRATHFDN